MWRFLPMLDLRGYDMRAARADFVAAGSVIFLTVPQGIAYAMIAGLPPVMGLYAAVVPTMVGALFRSSRHVISDTSNALSLLVGGLAALQLGVDPMTAAVTLACLVGLFQVCAGLLGLGTVVDFISRSVVLGYISGAAVLIGVGQLPNLTGTESVGGSLPERLFAWVASLPHTSGLAVAVALGTAAIVLLSRAIDRRIPAASLAMGAATLVSVLLGLHDKGLEIVSDLAPVPRGFPPLTIPDVSLFPQLVPMAVAAAVLSLVESSAVARAIASRTRQRIDASVEFFGQGLANVAAGFTGGYPVSGSLSRSTLNERAGAVSRMSGVFAGAMILVVLLVLGPVVNHTPIAALAGLLLVVAYDLLDWGRIRLTLHAGWGDRITFAVTMLGTWILRLDHAIYLGVALSLIFFLRQARLLVVREMIVSPSGRLRELDEEDAPAMAGTRCEAIHVLQLEGGLFFGVEGELQAALDAATANPAVQVLVVRVKRTQGLDATVVGVIQERATQLMRQGRHLILVGMRPDAMDMLERTGLAAQLGKDHLYPTKPLWFGAMQSALEHALSLVEGHDREHCPIERLLKSVEKR